VTADTIYDHPRYYDILFGWDRSKEAAFYDGVLSSCGVGAEAPVLEVACGTGRVARLLAERGRNVAGLDVRPRMLTFLRERSAQSGLQVTTLYGDMTDFRTPLKFAGAYNPMNSFRLLHSDAAAEAHLQCMARALQPRGVYVLDLDFAASADEPGVTTDQDWEMTEGNVTVSAGNDSIVVDDDGVRSWLVWGEDHLRVYTSATFADRVAAAGGFTIEAWLPESTRATGVSEWSVDHRVEPPVVGRTMVLLRRD
jgi:SAM-dependent methyltransferase